MELNVHQKPWMSADQKYLAILWIDRQPLIPTNREQMLLDQSSLLEQLIEQASPGEVQEANLQLQDGLPQTMLDFLPQNLLEDPETPVRIMMNPAEEGTNFQEWKAGLQEALEGNPATPEETKQVFKELTLGSYLDLIL